MLRQRFIKALRRNREQNQLRPAIELMADPTALGKGQTFIERFRDVISDPLNILIDRIPEAGYVTPQGHVFLHNGNLVHLLGKHSYYGHFSDLLILNRGVHEPLEEFCFQRMLRVLNDPEPTMIELGAYWGHYSMWLKKKFPNSITYLVEPSSDALAAGISNYELNGYEGIFIEEEVGPGKFLLDDFLGKQSVRKVTILHADIQGAEMDMMLGGAEDFFPNFCADYIYISTHSNDLHASVLQALLSHGYIIEVNSPLDQDTTSFDGFILATSPKTPRLFEGFQPMGRHEILTSSTARKYRYIGEVARRFYD